MKKLLQLLLGIGVLVGLSTGSFASQKAAYIPCGQVNDGSWSQAGYEAMLVAKKRIGLDFDHVESPAPADVENIGRDFVSERLQSDCLPLCDLREGGPQNRQGVPQDEHSAIHGALSRCRPTLRSICPNTSTHSWAAFLQV